MLALLLTVPSRHAHGRHGHHARHTAIMPSLEAMLAAPAPTAAALTCHARFDRMFPVFPMDLAVTKASVSQEAENKDWKKTTVRIRTEVGDPAGASPNVPQIIVEWSGGGDAVPYQGIFDRGHEKRYEYITPASRLRDCGPEDNRCAIIFNPAGATRVLRRELLMGHNSRTGLFRGDAWLEVKAEVRQLFDRLPLMLELARTCTYLQWEARGAGGLAAFHAYAGTAAAAPGHEVGAWHSMARLFDRRWLHARDATDYRGTGDEPVTPAPAHVLVPSNNAPVVAIGDVHGDVEFLIGQLSTHPCIETDPAAPAAAGVPHGLRLRWMTGCEAYLIFTGDLLDRKRHEGDDGEVGRGQSVAGDDEGRALFLLNMLAVQAAAEGGALIRLHGNHDLYQHNYARKYHTQRGATYWSQRAVLENTGSTPSKKGYFAPSEPGAIEMGSFGARMLVDVGNQLVFVHGGLASPANMARILDANYHSDRAGQQIMRGTLFASAANQGVHISNADALNHYMHKSRIAGEIWHGQAHIGSTDTMNPMEDIVILCRDQSADKMQSRVGCGNGADGLGARLYHLLARVQVDGAGNVQRVPIPPAGAGWAHQPKLIVGHTPNEVHMSHAQWTASRDKNDAVAFTPRREQLPYPGLRCGCLHDTWPACSTFIIDVGGSRPFDTNVLGRLLTTTAAVEYEVCMRRASPACLPTDHLPLCAQEHGVYPNAFEVQLRLIAYNDHHIDAIGYGGVAPLDPENVPADRTALEDDAWRTHAGYKAFIATISDAERAAAHQAAVTPVGALVGGAPACAARDAAVQACGAARSQATLSPPHNPTPLRLRRGSTTLPTISTRGSRRRSSLA